MSICNIINHNLSFLDFGWEQFLVGMKMRIGS